MSELSNIQSNFQKELSKASNKEQKITIQGGTGLSDDEIEKMTKDAEVHAEEDKKKKEEVEVRNNAENIIFQTEKFIKENKDKLKDEDKKKMQDKVDEMKKVKDSQDLEVIKKAVANMEETVQTVGASMYQQQQGAAGAAGPEAAKEDDKDKKADKDAVEGDFEEVKDEDKNKDKKDKK